MDKLSWKRFSIDLIFVAGALTAMAVLMAPKAVQPPPPVVVNNPPPVVEPQVAPPPPPAPHPMVFPRPRARDPFKRPRERIKNPPPDNCEHPMPGKMAAPPPRPISPAAGGMSINRM